MRKDGVKGLADKTMGKGLMTDLKFDATNFKF